MDIRSLALQLHQNPHLLDMLEQNHPEVAQHLIQQLTAGNTPQGQPQAQMQGQGLPQQAQPGMPPQQMPDQTMPPQGQQQSATPHIDMVNKVAQKYLGTKAGKKIMKGLESLSPDEGPTAMPDGPTGTAGIRG